MNLRKYKGRIEKVQMPKCLGVCQIYNPIQGAYAERLSNDPSIKNYQCHIFLEGLDAEREYTSDFLCTRQDDTVMVRETVKRSSLSRGKTVKLLELSQHYWAGKGIADWGIVTDEEE